MSGIAGQEKLPKIILVNDDIASFYQVDDDPLSRFQAFKIQSICLEDVRLEGIYSNYSTLRGAPSGIAILWKEMLIGIAYGSKVSSGEWCDNDKGAQEILSKVRSAYLHRQVEYEHLNLRRSSPGFLTSMIEMFFDTECLSRRQVYRLAQLYEEGLESDPERIDLNPQTYPTSISFRYRGRRICTAYGNRVVVTPFSGARKDPKTRDLIRRIEDCLK